MSFIAKKKKNFLLFCPIKLFYGHISLTLYFLYVIYLLAKIIIKIMSEANIFK